MERSPDVRTAWRGGVLALGAAILFGSSTPFIKQASSGSGAFWTAALLYIGASGAGLLLRGAPATRTSLGRKHMARLLAVALSGAVAGPSLFAWGLQHTSATSASLVLVLEAVFTALLARLLYREHIGIRVILALLLMTAGGAFLAMDNPGSDAAGILGLMAVVLATLAWALDNALSRPLSTLDPGRVVLGKSALGALASTSLAVAFRQSFPPMESAFELLVVGTMGYGLSLRLYLLAQREFGATRTGSVFAFAPFVGAVISVVISSSWPGWNALVGCLLMLVGVVLHLTEENMQGPGRRLRNPVRSSD